MKKLVSFIALCAIATPAFSATKAPRPSQLVRAGDGKYDVTYNYTDKAKSGWYASLRAELALLNWTNKYSSDSPTINDALDSEDFSFEPLFSANLAFGKRFNYFWRAEVEAGYISRFEDEDEDSIIFWLCDIETSIAARPAPRIIEARRTSSNVNPLRMTSVLVV